MQRARKIDEEERETRKKQEEEREALKRKRDEEMVCVFLCCTQDSLHVEAALLLSTKKRRMGR